MQQKQQAQHKKHISLEPILIHLGIFLGWLLPRKVGYWVATAAGKLLGSLKRNKMVKAIRANQYVIHEEKMSAEELDEIPKKVFVSAGKCLFDYFHFLPRPGGLQKIISFSPEARAAIERIQNRQPTVVVVPHLSNFDLMGYALALHNVQIQVLSYPNPNATYKVQNRLRERTGITVTPLDFSAFRKAKQRLREGGSVLTGLDRPLTDNNDNKYRPQFFGHATNLPVAYIRMALEAQVPVIVLAVLTQPDGGYRLVGSAPIPMIPNDNLATEILTNAERVLKVAETFIIQNAQQWAMYYPIWPQFLGV
jgi:KDO2-lipid IV(A) lauroyltransferase